MSSLKEKMNKEGGFTIIEVVLVLAIAGLIFLIVFLALPQLQRSRRDTQRRSDAGRVLAALESYSQNTNGQYPDVTAPEFEGFLDDYFNWNNNDASLSELFDPSEDNFTLEINNDSPDLGELSYADGDCAGNNTGGRTRSIIIGLEDGGQYCQDNR